MAPFTHLDTTDGSGGSPRPGFLRWLSISAALLSLTTILDPRDKTRAMLIWGPKLVGGALAPLLALLGGIYALIGLRRRDWAIVISGLFTSLASSRYARRVTAPHDGFDQAFGTRWQDRLDGSRQQYMLPARWQPLVAAPKASCQRDISFGISPETGQPLLADLWQPPAGIAPSGLGLVYLHGGSWHLGDKDMGTGFLFRRLAAQGHVILDIAYTLAPQAEIATMVQEAKLAILWLKAQGHAYGVCADRVVLVGSSAGGHLALLAAYSAKEPRLQPPGHDGDTSVRAVVSFYGPTDLRACYVDAERARRQLVANHRSSLSRKLAIGLMSTTGMIVPGATPESSTNVIQRVLHCPPGEDPDSYRLLSPIDYASAHLPPTLLLQSGTDIFDIAPAARRLHAALQEAGATSILVEFPDTEHAFDLVLPQVSPSAQAALYDLERFLALVV